MASDDACHLAVQWMGWVCQARLMIRLCLAKHITSITNLENYLKCCMFSIQVSGLDCPGMDSRCLEAGTHALLHLFLGYRYMTSGHYNMNMAGYAHI